ncbi:NrdH-redoxin [Candidatus Pacearchaeota archaeon]|nr:NrdH-redoxin [Candidatus Pacearchaeota archaeon]
MNNITIYTLNWCPHCKELKEFLINNKIEFENIDVEQDQDIAQDIMEKTGSEGFPITDIDGEYIIGLDIKKIKEILNI